MVRTIACDNEINVLSVIVLRYYFHAAFYYPKRGIWSRGQDLCVYFVVTSTKVYRQNITNRWLINQSICAIVYMACSNHTVGMK
jgi:hypothetical protein